MFLLDFYCFQSLGREYVASSDCEVHSVRQNEIDFLQLDGGGDFDDRVKGENGDEIGVEISHLKWERIVRKGFKK